VRVGLLTTSYPRHEGDYRGVFVKNLVDALRRSGVDVEVIEPKGYGPLKRGAGLIPNLKSSNAARLLFPVYCAHFLVVALVGAARCDLLHANWSLSGFFAVIAGGLLGKRVLLTERSSFLIGSRNARVNSWMGWVMRRCAAVVTISGGAREALAEKFPRIEIGVIPNGVDDSLFSPAHRRDARRRLSFDDGLVHVATVARLTEGKRLDVLLSALSGLSSRGLDYRAWVVGGGELLEPLRRRVEEESGLSGRVALVGEQTQREVADWLAAADVFVFTSAGESGGNVLLEAMSSGAAVVSTPVGWAADFVSGGDNGILTPIGDASALEEHLAALLADATERGRLGAAARATIEERGLNWEGCARRYIEYYRELL